MAKDVKDIVKTCKACLKISGKHFAPSQPSQLIMLVWPHRKWGMDIVGQLTMAQGNYKYAIVAVEYFSKWIEAKAVTNISAPTEKYQEETRKWRDKKIVPRAYSLGDLVLIRTQRTEAKGKLEPKWEGLFIISKVGNPRSYRLKTMDDEELQHS